MELVCCEKRFKSVLAFYKLLKNILTTKNVIQKKGSLTNGQLQVD